MDGDRDDAGDRGVLVDRHQLAREPGAAHHLARHHQPEPDRDRHQDQGEQAGGTAGEPPAVGLQGFGGGGVHAPAERSGMRMRGLAASGPTVSTRPSSWTSRPPRSASTTRPPLGAGEQRRLGEGLGFDRGVAQGGGADQAGPGRLARRRVEQVVGVAAALVAPDPHVEAGGGDGAGAELEHEGALARQRVLDEDLVGSDEGVGAADADVAAAVDDEARVAAQAAGDEVGGEALAGAAGVEADAGGATDRAAGVVDLEARASSGPGWGPPGGARAPLPGRRPVARRARPPAKRRSRRTRSRRAGSGRPGRRCARPPRSRP